MNCVCGHSLERHLFVDFGDERDGCDASLCDCPLYYEDVAAEIDRYAR